MLPDKIKERFFKTLKGDIPIHEFERWLYEDKELEALLNQDDYLELISLNFKRSGAKYELSKLLEKNINLGEYETYKMLELLYVAKKKTDELPDILMQFYDLYCRGYYFLHDLGLGYGLAVEVPCSINKTAETWDDLTEQEQQELLDSFSPGLEREINRVIYWIKDEEIVLTGEQDDLDHYQFKDLRTEEEKKSKIWKTVYENKSTGAAISKSTLPGDQPRKKWWEFWKH